MQEEEAIFTGLNFVLTTAPRFNKGLSIARANKARYGISYVLWL